METLQRAANRGSISTGFDIDNSLKLEEDNTEYLHYTPSSQTDYERLTFSLWIKRTEIGATSKLAEFGNGTANTTNLRIGFDDSDRLYIYGNSIVWRESTQVFRDTSAWYHLFFKFDTTQGTSNDKIRVWVNGNMIAHTDYNTVNNPSSGSAMGFNTTLPQSIGTQQEGGVNASTNFNGYIAQVWYSGGTPPNVTDFGEVDSDSGIWKPIDISGVSIPDASGFFLDFSDSSDLGNDSSSNNNDFTLVNITAADQATDTPTNNFCIVNNNTRQGNQYGAYNANQQATNGGTVIVEPTGSFGQISATFGVGSGKWYWEMKPVGMVGFSTAGQIYGITSPVNLGGSESRSEIRPGATTAVDTSAQYAIYPMYTDQSRSYRGDSDSSANWTSSDEGAANNVIWRIALDLDNGKIWYGRNNVWLPDKSTDTASNPSTGSNARDTDLLGATRLVGGFYLPSFGMYNENSGHTMQTNFGGYSIISNSKSYSDGNGYGAFVYEVPTGFYSICSKNLAEYG